MVASLGMPDPQSKESFCLSV